MASVDLSFRNSIKHIKKLWNGEEIIHKAPIRWEQGDCIFNKEFDDTTNALSKVSLQNPLTNLSLESDSLEKEPPFDKKKLLQTSLIKEQEMAPIVGTYQHQLNENLDEYFKALGVPYIPRKMMAMSSPRIEITNENDKWTIRSISMMRTMECTFILGENYDETMPSGETLKSVTTMNEDSLVTVSVRPDSSKIIRKYDFTDDDMVITMTHEASGQVAKRYFKRMS